MWIRAADGTEKMFKMTDCAAKEPRKAIAAGSGNSAK